MFKRVPNQKFDKLLQEFVDKRPELRNKVIQVMQTILEDYRNRSLKTHKLDGKLSDYYSSSINHSYRIIFMIAEDGVQFLNIGDHDDVY